MSDRELIEEAQAVINKLANSANRGIRESALAARIISNNFIKQSETLIARKIEIIHKEMARLEEIFKLVQEVTDSKGYAAKQKSLKDELDACVSKCQIMTQSMEEMKSDMDDKFNKINGAVNKIDSFINRCEIIIKTDRMRGV